MTITSEERLFTLLIDEADVAITTLGDCPERDELSVAILGLERRLAIIRGCDGR